MYLSGSQRGGCTYRPELEGKVVPMNDVCDVFRSVSVRDDVVCNNHTGYYL